ncbi:MAG: multidrug effflux MFS transporter [Pseudomonadota bacterium]
MSLNYQRLIFIIYLATLSAFAPFSTDIYLASMPTIKAAFNTSASNVQLTLSLFFISFAITQLLWGPLSDRIGRKPVVFIGASVYVVGSLLCALSHDITNLIIFRIIQAIGACAGLVMAIAIVKDSFPDSKEMTKILTGMLSVMILAPMIAPIIGSYLLVYINWQANFYFLAIYGLLLIFATCFIKESHPDEARKPLPMNKLFHSYTEQIGFVRFLLPTLAIATNFSVIFAFISSSAFIYINIYLLKTAFFGYLFAFNASGLIIGSTVLNRLKNQIRDSQIILLAILISFIGSLSMLISVYLFPHSIWSVIIPTFIVTCSIGMLFAELTSQALKHVVAHTGLASSLIGSFRFILAAGVGYIMGIIITDSAIPLALVMLMLNLFTAIFMLLYFKYIQ